MKHIYTFLLVLVLLPTWLGATPPPPTHSDVEVPTLLSTHGWTDPVED